jgi:hypothetical protein
MSSNLPGSDEHFENPPENQNQAGAGPNDGLDEEAEWDQPSEEPAADAESAGISVSEQAFPAFSERLLNVHAQIEQALQQQVRAASSGPRAMAEDVYEGAGNIVGVGLGSNLDDPASGLEPGAACVNVYVAEPCSAESVKQTLASSLGVRAAADDDVPVNIIRTGIIDAQPHRFKIRPAPGGVSCGHFKITAGTLGCLSRGRRSPRDRRILILSNNHVLANSNSAQFGDSIIQPGRADGGVSPGDRIAILERFVPINFSGGANVVDCATGWAWSDRVRRELVYLSGGQRRFFRISSSIVPCRLGMTVGKSGRTTQLTVGRITDCNATIRVNYGAGRVALFRDQITIRGLSGDFSAGGDSGSVIWTWDSQRNPVGLLFAGGGGFTFANKNRTRAFRLGHQSVYLSGRAAPPML